VSNHQHAKICHRLGRKSPSSVFGQAIIIVRAWLLLGYTVADARARNIVYRHDRHSCGPIRHVFLGKVVNVWL
jgi:hypothetical protein